VSTPFGSTLSIGEFLALDGAGFRPLGPVIGTSVYHVGWQRPPSAVVRASVSPRVVGSGPASATRVYFPKGGLAVADYLNEGSTLLLEKPTAAYNDARRNALARLRESARELGALAVVDVRIRQGTFDLADGAVEFIALGTAVTSEDAERTDPGRIAVVTLAGGEFWKLLRGGFRPLGLVGGSSVVYVLAGFRTKRTRFALSRVRFRNQEYEDYTKGLYEARREAMKRLRQDARDLGAAGMIGIELSHELEEAPFLRRREKDDFVITAHVLGTAVAPFEALDPSTPQYAVDLRSES
jgi:uncharacterized protein YbjQ (UPF0145 family)